MFRNDQQKFVDVSDEAGILNDGIGFGLGLAIGDLNNDQWPDIVVGQDFASKDRIYLNQKNGTFKEVAEEVTGHLSNFSMGNDMADFNNDGWLDFMSLDMADNDFDYFDNAENTNVYIYGLKQNFESIFESIKDLSQKQCQILNPFVNINHSSFDTIDQPYRYVIPVAIAMREAL